MSLLPKPRSLAYGGKLPEDPLVTERKKKQLAGQGVGEQVGAAIQQAPSILSTLGIGGGATSAAGGAATGVAEALPGIGLAVAAGSLIGGKLRAGQVDDQGFQKTGFGNQAVSTLADAIDPIGNTVKAFDNVGRDDLNVAQKIGSFIPGFSSRLTAGADEAAKKKAEDEKRKRDAENAMVQNNAATRSTYGGLAGGFRQGGLLPRRFAVGGALEAEAAGGRPPKKEPAPAPASTQPVQYSLNNPSPEAQQYYKNVLPTTFGLLKNKHDEVYTDPTTGKQCTANSCLSFATTVLEKATGTTQPRTKANLYNPEFTRTAHEQGWETVPLDQAQAGDRLQYWNAAGNEANGVSRVSDLGSNQLIAGKYPSHMMVFGGWAGEQTDAGTRRAVVYNDGHQFERADRDIRDDVNPNEYVAYRYVGVNGQPTNNPAQAVAPNPAAQKQTVASRAKGGLLPRSVIATGALHSEKNQHAGHPTAGKRGIPVLDATGNKLAEVERDEWTLADSASKRLESLRQGGSLLALGKHVQRELLTNTTASPRYAKRLLPVK